MRPSNFHKKEILGKVARKVTFLALAMSLLTGILFAQVTPANGDEEIRRPILPPPDIRLAVSFGGGYSVLLGDWADHFKNGPFAKLGVRFSYPTSSYVVAQAIFSYHRHNGLAEGTRLSKYEVGGGLVIQPLRYSRISPYAQLNFAFASVHSELNDRSITSDLGFGGGVEFFFGIERKFSINVGSFWHYTRVYIGDDGGEHSSGLQSVQFPVILSYYIY